MIISLFFVIYFLFCVFDAHEFIVWASKTRFDLEFFVSKSFFRLGENFAKVVVMCTGTRSFLRSPPYRCTTRCTHSVYLYIAHSLQPVLYGLYLEYDARKWVVWYFLGITSFFALGSDCSYNGRLLASVEKNSCRTTVLIANLVAVKNRFAFQLFFLQLFRDTISKLTRVCVFFWWFFWYW